MADTVLDAPRALRNFVCEGCAASIQGIRRTKKFCEACAKQARLASARKYDAANPRDRSVQKQRKCCGCSTEFVTTKAWVRYCDPCRAEAREAGPSEHYYLRNPTATSISGEHRTCRHCGGGFPVKAKRQVFCCRSCRQKAESATPEVRLNARVRAGIHKTLKSGKGGRSWSELVGYSVEELKAHLERQFLPGMGWHNMGDWHLDHRLPLASFSFDSAEHPDFRAAWALTNLQPLWAEQNIKKKAQRLFLV
ncbi:hypothetical protein [Microvirga arsenatis]|uniref:HNH endonuclease n=1 Tax=Microvirga arsenatis TaxID=2692265 RepID=A0ABW9YUS2_9HYPH|nr:hypothetical protein [Microvirga arsenatis]NBJ13328.1 hypothetical protein [Microvirga arsenatis]NBJ24112.1 hypothetical protein [Microvirga arsenatis]